MSGLNEEELIIKIKYYQEVHRVRVTSDITYEQFIQLFLNILPNCNLSQCLLEYKDDEKDDVVINSEAEFAEAILLTKAINPHMLRITVKPKRICKFVGAHMWWREQKCKKRFMYIFFASFVAITLYWLWSANCCFIFKILGLAVLYKLFRSRRIRCWLSCLFRRLGKWRKEFCNRQRCEWNPQQNVNVDTPLQPMSVRHQYRRPVVVPVHPPVQTPMENFENELFSLAQMGFKDRIKNIRALAATNGDLYETIERLSNDWE
eukprot:TRINITY_DN7595_c0_g1_i1.p1 TRINITY_DN7595_c0_g1~~TRINITY_DN7595_c0_g1_i1.p1  ORF type:complete len:275 (-),score=35.92 TRINITY_DN7595_c0_g1_i1:81-866(-)